RWHDPHARTCRSWLPYRTIAGIGGYMLGNQLGISYMSSALARVIESVLPDGAGLTWFASKRGGGWTFSVTGDAQSGFSAAAASVGTSASARTPMRLFMLAPDLFSCGRRMLSRRVR